jgi:hypothetical protein
MGQDFIDIKKKKPKKGELVIVKLSNGTEREAFRCGCVDSTHNGWAEPIIGLGIKIDVVSWRYAQESKN